MSYLKDREIWLSNVPTGNPPAGYVWVFIQNGVFVVRDSNGLDKIMATTTGTVTNATSASYVEYSNVASKPALISGSSQVSYTGLSNIPVGIVSGSSQITYSGLTGIPSGIVSGSAQVASFGIFATTGSNGFNGSQSITGSLTVTGQVVAQTLNVQQVTSSIVYSSGSNVFGNTLANTQQFTGSVGVTGSLTVNGIATSGTVSGTTNYISKFTGTNTIGNSAIFDGGGFGGFNNTGVAARTFIIQATSGRPFALEVIESANVHAIYMAPNNSGFNRISSDYMSGGVFLPLSLTGRENNADLVLQTNGNIGIGTTAPISTNLNSALTIYKVYNNDGSSIPSPNAQQYGDNQSGLYLFGRNSGLTIVGANNEANQIIFANSSTVAYASINTTTGTTSIGGDMYFNVGSNTERMRITSDGYVRLSASSGGLQFNGDTAAANALDDYEEGTWTPTWSSSGGTINTNSTFTTGRYTKIGNVVHIWARLYTNSVSSPTGEVTVSGLPFTVGSQVGNKAMHLFTMNAITGTLTGTPTIAFNTSNTTATIYNKIWNSSEFSGDIATYFDNDTWGYFYGTYTV